MRLIDADALLNRMQKDPLFDLVERYGVSGVINAEPTVDAVPVIRCKDCKKFVVEEDQAYCLDMFGQCDENGFCAWAERKEE